MLLKSYRHSIWIASKPHTKCDVLFAMHDCDQFGSAAVLVTLMLVRVSYKKMCLQRYSTYHLKAHSISNNMVLKLPPEVRGGRLVIRNLIKHFFGFGGVSPDLPSRRGQN